MKATDNGIVADDFADEICLVMETAKGLVVLVGCSHPGILNMISTIHERLHKPIYGVIGGTHLMKIRYCHDSQTGSNGCFYCCYDYYCFHDGSAYGYYGIHFSLGSSNGCNGHRRRLNGSFSRQRLLLLGCVSVLRHDYEPSVQMPDGYDCSYGLQRGNYFGDFV
jgi:hypothetical protein